MTKRKLKCHACGVRNVLVEAITRVECDALTEEYVWICNNPECGYIGYMDVGDYPIGWGNDKV